MPTGAPVTVAVVGAGYWGPNLIRNFLGCPSTDLRWVCDLEPARGRRILGDRTAVAVTDSLDEILDDPHVEAVAVATPAATHMEIALACLEAGKHVLVEKPLATSAADAEKLVAVAERAGLVLMTDHTYCYTAAVMRIRAAVEDGTLGDLQYIDSVRINLGLVQPDIDVFWDLAPHDLSILDFVLPGGCSPVAVAAQGADPIGAGVACIGYLTLHLGDGAIAHVHVNWLSPTKIRTAIFGGSRQIVVWDDLNPTQRLSMYDKGVDLGEGPLTRDARREAMVSYRLGDMVAPALHETEALGGVAREFASAIREHRRPLTDGEAGLRVVRILEAVGRSIDAGGAAVPLGSGPTPEVDAAGKRAE
jgi:predicted dehydrogenase